MTVDGDRALDERARGILRGNDRGGYTVPTDGLYPFQWNWDSAFAALGFATFDRPRAWRELETLLGGQWPNGMVPHILFHREDEGYFPGPDVWASGTTPSSSGITQPPVATSAVRWLLERGFDADLAPDARPARPADPVAGTLAGGEPSDGASSSVRPTSGETIDARTSDGMPVDADRSGDEARARALYPKLLAWHRWFMDWRLEEGVVCITHPWESGRDNAPDWDGAMAGVDATGVAPYTRRDTGHVDASMRPTKADYDRYVALLEFGRDGGWDERAIRARGSLRVADPTMTFVLLRAHRDLAALATRLGEPTDEIRGWIATIEAGVPGLWNAETAAFDARDTRTGELAGSLSNASFLAWYGGVDEPRLIATLERVLDAVPYAVPSHPPWSERFDRKRYWRGPVWAIMNFMIARGLAERGHETHAARVRESTAALIRAHGFAEYFDPIDGSPAGGGTFTWTAAVWLAWASPTAAPGRFVAPAADGTTVDEAGVGARATPSGER